MEIHKSKVTLHFARLAKLGLIVIVVFAFTYGPFIGQLPEVS